MFIYVTYVKNMYVYLYYVTSEENNGTVMVR